MHTNDPITKSVSNAYMKMKAEELSAKQKKHIDKNNNNKIDSHDFKLLRKEDNEVEGLDEISKKTATSAYVARMGREDDKSPDKAVKTMDRIYKKHGATGVMRAATAADKKYGIHSADYTKKDFVGDYLSGHKFRKEEDEVEEGWDDMMKAVKAKSGPQPSGGSGIKKGSRYGGSNQKDEPEVKEKPTAKTKKKPFSEMLETYKSAGLKSLFEAIEEKVFVEEVESIEEEDTGYMDRYAVKNGKAVKDNPKQRNYDDDEPHHVYADSPEHAVRKYAKMKKPGMKKEEVEELEELSKDTLNSYVKKSFSDKEKDNLNTPERQKGLRKATSRLYKEDEEHIEELSTPTLASYVKKVGHEGEFTKKRVSGLNKALTKVKQNSMKSEDMDIDAINGVRMSTVEELDEISTKTLAAAAKSASDPESDYYYGKSHDAQKFADHAKKTKDAKSAAAVQGAADAKGHYPRPGHTLGSYDKLAYRTPSRVTAAGKANKQDTKALKTKLKEEDMDINAINGVRMHTFKELYGDRGNNN